MTERRASEQDCGSKEASKPTVDCTARGSYLNSEEQVSKIAEVKRLPTLLWTAQPGARRASEQDCGSKGLVTKHNKEFRAKSNEEQVSKIAEVKRLQPTVAAQPGLLLNSEYPHCNERIIRNLERRASEQDCGSKEAFKPTVDCTARGCYLNR
ncbi:hypothetical protein J6590_012667 [Homalodisca vitripennis]|nr:hypothetical protein J6590_012667 [Homalodisca vitripennis]